MRQSQLFTKTQKDAPTDEVSKNAILLSRAGYIHKEMAGVYAYLPLGLRVLNNIIKVIREEMNAIGGQELTLTALQDKELWQRTNRWDDAVVDAWFKTRLKNDTEVGLGFTHEEPLTELMKAYVSSYRDLPFSAYQFQTKFRNETRAKSGILRTREFIMKDLYSFSKNKEEHDEFYEKVKQAYTRIFNRLGIGEDTYVTFASGGVFSQFSHEFQTICDAGEDIIYVDEKKRIAVNKEVYTDEVLQALGLNKDELVEKKAIETGNIFTLGTRFSDTLGLTYNSQNGEKDPVFMGSYGIGPARSMGTIVELLSDEKGIVWPKEIAPFRAHLVLASSSEAVKELAEELYKTLQSEGIEVLFDDRDVRAGEKFADSDLIGIPTRIIVGDKTAGGMYEVKDRKTGETRQLALEHLLTELK
jgi:prolyl-tRNA synthetase